MCHNIATFTEELLENALDLVVSLLSSGSPKAKDLIRSLIVVIVTLLENLIEILQTIIPTADQALRWEINAVITTLQDTKVVVIRMLRASIPALRQNRQAAITAVEEFVRELIAYIADLLDSLCNPPTPGF